MFRECFFERKVKIRTELSKLNRLTQPTRRIVQNSRFDAINSSTTTATICVISGQTFLKRPGKSEYTIECAVHTCVARSCKTYLRKMKRARRIGCINYSYVIYCVMMCNNSSCERSELQHAQRIFCRTGWGKAVHPP